MTSSVGYGQGKRPGTAYAAAQAARQRRQLIFVGLLVVGLIVVLVLEAPTFMKLFRGSKTAAPPVPPTVPVTPQTPSTQNDLAAIRRSPAADPFATAVGGPSDPSVRAAAIPPGSHDPFALPATSGSTPTVTLSALPQQLVIGTPGGNKKATHGWIVILASIPTGQGQSSANSFAAGARSNGIGSIAVLNSSTRKPLRGGYWVVYTGPFKTLSEVSAVAATVHSHGYATAYIRELIVYS